MIDLLKPNQSGDWDQFKRDFEALGEMDGVR